MRKIKKIAILVILEIAIIISSFTMLMFLEEQQVDTTNLINISGKNRFLASMILNNAHNYEISQDFQALKDSTNNLNENLLLLKYGNEEMNMKPIPKEFLDKWESMYQTFSVLESKVQEFENTQKSHELDNITTEFINEADIFTDELSSYLENQDRQIMLIERLLLILDVSVLLFLIYIVINMIKKERMDKNELRMEVEQIKKALDESSIVAITDTKGNITYANQKFCNISKYSQDELIGKNHRILKSGVHSDKFYRDMWKTISSGKTWIGEIKNKAKDGSYYWVNTTIVPIKNEVGDITQYVSIRNDITKRKKLQDELIKNERFSAIGQLASRLSHDLRNPLAIVINGIELIKETSEEEFTQDSCRRIDKALERMNHQISDVLDFVRVRPNVYEEIRLKELIKKSVQDLHIPASIGFNTPQENPTIKCDVEKLSNVLGNIIHNALQKFTTEGSITIRYSDDDKNHRIEIQDSGESIPNEDLERIFEPLFTTKEQGTGLGLAGCKKIIDEHHGKIYASNNPTTITIILPKSMPK